MPHSPIDSVDNVDNVDGPGNTTSRRSLLRGAAVLVGLAAVGTAVPAQASAAAEGVTLKILVNQPHLRPMTNVVAPAWAQQTGGKLEVTATDYTQLTDKMIADVRSGTGEFDLFDYLYYGLGSLVQADALVDLTGWIAGQKKDIDPRDFLPSIYDPYTLYKGRRYGLPFDGSQQLIFYNTEIFATYGVHPPTTWDEYDAAARKISEGSGGTTYGAVVQGQADPLVLGCAFINRLVGYGGDLVDRSGKPTLTSDAARAAAQHLIDIRPHALTTVEVGFTTGNNAFLNGQAALLETWTGMAQRADNPALSNIVGKWGAVAVPLGGGNRSRRTPLDSGYGLGVSTASTNKAAALEFVKWATSSAQMLVQTTSPDSAFDPNRTSVLHSPAYAEATPAGVDLIRAGLDGTPMVWPKDPNARNNMLGLANQLALAMAGKQDARTALRNAQASWER
jgi:multiple sugar transport system substrate-binding protein